VDGNGRPFTVSVVETDGRQVGSVGAGDRIAYIYRIPAVENVVVVVADVPPADKLALETLAITVPPE